MRLLTREEKKEYHFLLQFIDIEVIDIKPQKPPKDFENVKKTLLKL